MVQATATERDETDRVNLDLAIHGDRLVFDGVETQNS